MAIILDRCNKIKTNHLDFINALKKMDNGLRCCFNLDMIVYEYTPTLVDDFQLIPLEKFSCKRSIIGNHNTKINIESCFGLIKGDFINIDLHVVDLEENKQIWKGLLINKTNPYFEIIKGVAIYFGFVDNSNNKSFILDESELSDIQLVPFRLKYVDNHFVVSDIEDEMATSEYDSIIDGLYCDDYAL